MATVTHRPAGDAVVTFIAGFPVDTSGDRYQNVNEAVLDNGDYVFSTWPHGGGPGSGSYRARTTVIEGELAGKSITSLKVSWWVRNNFASGQRAFSEVIRIGSTDYYGDQKHPTPDSLTVKYDFTWPQNPATGEEWTPAEIEAFRVGGTNSVGIDLESDGDQPSQIVLMMMEVVVTHEPALTGQAVGAVPIF